MCMLLDLACLRLAGNVDENAPYAAVNKELDIDAWNRTAEIKNAGGTPVTSELIKNTFADVLKGEAVNVKYKSSNPQ